MKPKYWALFGVVQIVGVVCGYWGSLDTHQSLLACSLILLFPGYSVSLGLIELLRLSPVHTWVVGIPIILALNGLTWWCFARRSWSFLRFCGLVGCFLVAAVVSSIMLGDRAYVSTAPLRSFDLSGCIGVAIALLCVLAVQGYRKRIAASWRWCLFAAFIAVVVSGPFWVIRWIK